VENVSVVREQGVIREGKRTIIRIIRVATKLEDIWQFGG
jgi:hypothetical protein